MKGEKEQISDQVYDPIYLQMAPFTKSRAVGETPFVTKSIIRIEYNRIK